MTITRRNYGKGHSYYVDGVKFDGVTTLIKGGLPSPALMYWSARTVAEYVADNLEQVTAMAPMGRNSIVAALKETPWTKRDAAAAKGTDVHTLAEKLIHGEQVDVPEEIAGYVESCVKFLDEWNVRPVVVEATVASRRWRYAGTLDAVADLTDPKDGDVRAIYDYKTSASGIWPETAYQLAGYRNAEVYVDTNGDEQPMADLGITRGYGVWLRSDGYDVLPVDCGEQTYKAFLHIAYVARAAKDNKTLIGEAVHV